MGVEARRFADLTSTPVAPEVSLIVPAYNEATSPVRAGAFRGMLEGNMMTLSREYGSRWEILVHDDGSTDGTPEIAAEFGVATISHPDGQNHGKGATVRNGMLRANGNYRAFADADGAYSPETILQLFSAVAEDGVDIAVAARTGAGHESYLRKAGHAVLEGICQYYAPSDSSDTQAGAKAFTADAAEQIWHRVQTQGFAADREAMHVAKRMGYQVADVPAEVIVVPGSHVRIVRDTIQIVKDTRAIAQRHKRVVPNQRLDRMTYL